jgi:hypothetical protein
MELHVWQVHCMLTLRQQSRILFSPLFECRILIQSWTFISCMKVQISLSVYLVIVELCIMLEIMMPNSFQKNWASAPSVNYPIVDPPADLTVSHLTWATWWPASQWIVPIVNGLAGHV